MINEATVHIRFSNCGKTNERPCLIHQAISEYQVLKARERPSHLWWGSLWGTKDT